jgi:hypothetical protein
MKKTILLSILMIAFSLSTYAVKDVNDEIQYAAEKAEKTKAKLTEVIETRCKHNVEEQGFDPDRSTGIVLFYNCIADIYQQAVTRLSTGAGSFDDQCN